MMGEHRSIEESIDKGLVDNPAEPSSNTEDAIVLVNRTSSDLYHKANHITQQESLGYKPVGKMWFRYVLLYN